MKACGGFLLAAMVPQRAQRLGGWPLTRAQSGTSYRTAIVLEMALVGRYLTKSAVVIGACCLCFSGVVETQWAVSAWMQRGCGGLRFLERQLCSVWSASKRQNRDAPKCTDRIRLALFWDWSCCQAYYHVSPHPSRILLRHITAFTKNSI